MDKTEQKSILFVIPFMPYPLKSGGHQALFNGIRAVKDDFKVFVTYEAEDNAENKNAEDKLRLLLPEVTLLPMLAEVPPPPQPKSYYPNSLIWRMKNRFWTLMKERLGVGESKPVCFSNIYDWWVNSLCPVNKAFAEHLDKIFKERNFDIVQVEMPMMIGTVFNVPEGIKKIFVHHEIAFVRHELEIKRLGAFPELIAYAGFSKMIEVNLLNKYDAVITLSEEDGKKLIDAGVSVPIKNSFAIVDTDRRSQETDVKRILSFVGAGFHNPNYGGINWFLENCWTALQNEYQLDIIGVWEPGIVKEITSKYPDVHFLGFVENLSAAVSGTTMIVPILIGSGIRMKILEAAAIGVPFVSTTVGAEGLPIENGVNGMIADSPDDFVNAILQLENVEFRSKLIDNAYAMVREKYSIDALRVNRVKIVDELIYD